MLIGLPRDATGFSCVDLDFEAAGRAAVAHLAGLGHRQIALIGSPRAVLSRRTTYAARLVRGFTQESARLGLDAVFETCESSHSGAIEAVDQVLAALPDVTAVIVHNEVALPAVLETLRSRGKDVPRRHLRRRRLPRGRGPRADRGPDRRRPARAHHRQPSRSTWRSAGSPVTSPPRPASSRPS